MVRGKYTGEGARSYTHGELADLHGQKQEIDATLKHLETNPGTTRSEGIDTNALKKQRDYLDKVIHDNKPKTARGGNRDGLAQEAKSIADRIQVGMPTHDEMDHPSKNPGAVHKHLNWAKRTDDDVRRYKEIMRRLEPEDPTAGNVERFRKPGNRR